jgi:hypothetical protein
LWEDFLVEDFDELVLLGRGRVVDIMRNKDGAQTGHGEGTGIEVRLEVGLIFHDGSGVQVSVCVCVVYYCAGMWEVKCT